MPTPEERAELVERLRLGGPNAAEVSSQAADEIDDLRDALHQIKQWGDAYPEDIFIPPTSEQCQQAHEALKAIGMSLDEFAAHSMRHVVRGVAKIAADALKESA